MDIADGPQDTQQVESDNSTTVRQSVDDTFEKGRLGQPDREWVGDAANLEKRVEQVLKRVGLGGDETLEQHLKRFRFEQLVLDFGGFIL